MLQLNKIFNYTNLSNLNCYFWKYKKQIVYFSYSFQAILPNISKKT